jgi:hypothetical protein
MTHDNWKPLVLTMLFVLFAAASVYGETLFFDDFDGPNLNPVWEAFLPDAPWRFDAGIAIFQGESNFSFQSLDGSSVIRLQNLLGDAERRGWSSSTSFPPDAPIVYEARFNTLVQSASTGIDELLEIWLLDANNPDNYDIVALSAPGFGSDRVFTAGSSITNVGLDTDFPFTDNTWYRMVISGSMTQEVRASIYNDAATVELIGVNFGHNLSAYTAGFKMGISQSMGLPGSPFPTDVALDSVRLTTAQTGDSDEDGVPDDQDECPDSNLSGTVVINGCNSGVPNTVFPSGCTISDMIVECAENASNHGRFVSCVSHLTNDLKKAGTITGQQKGAIQSCAAQANIP